MLLYSTLRGKKLALAPEGHKKLCLLGWGGRNRIDPIEVINRIERGLQVIMEKLETERSRFGEEVRPEMPSVLAAFEIKNF